MDQQPDNKNLASEYTALSTDRAPFLRRAHLCSKITIPTLIPRDSDRSTRTTNDVDVEQPWQSIGSAGVNALTAKFLSNIFPANTPFYQFTIGKKEREDLLKLEGEEATAMKAKLDAMLQGFEMEVLEDMELSILRPVVASCFKHLIVGGNYAMYIGDDEIKGFPLDRYVVRRDGSGNVIKAIFKECVAPEALDEKFLEEITKGRPSDAEKVTKGQDLDIYTCIKRVSKGKFVSYQEVLGHEVPGTRGRFTTETNPWMILRMIVVDGEDYGRAYVEELYGDLKTAEDLSKSIAQGAIIAAQVRWLVRPQGLTDIEDLEESQNGDYVPGDQEDVSALRAEKLADFQVAQQTLISAVDRLERAFLMQSSVQRNAERVTATEIGLMSQELQETLGAYYSLLAVEFQLPLIGRWVNKMQKQQRLPKWPKDSIRPRIITGIDALGRGQNLQRLRGFIQDCLAYSQIKATPLGPKMSDDEIVQRLANGHGVDVSNLVIPDEVIQQQQAEQQQAMQAQALAEKAAGPAAGALAQAATQPQQAA